MTSTIANQRFPEDYNRQREIFIDAWNRGVAIREEIRERYDDTRRNISDVISIAVNGMIRLLYETEQADSINRALRIIVSDDEFQAKCLHFPKTPQGLKKYIDKENAKRLLTIFSPNRKMLQNNRYNGVVPNVLEQCSDFELFENRGINIRPYNIWSFSADKRFGLSYPGGTPADIIFNTLYFYTEIGDLVVDPMAGGGVVGDCCYEVKRRYLMYDVQPSRPDIKQYDMHNGLPNEAYDADLLFWDPPYFKRMESSYGSQSISALDRKRYVEFFERFVKNIYECGIKKIAFLMADDSSSPQLSDKDRIKKGGTIFLYDYIKMFEAEGWRLLDRISCNGSMAQLTGTEVKYYREKKLIYGLARDLIIFKRGESK